MSDTPRGDNSYRNIMKRLSAFGGVQVFNILITLVRGKFVAMILGPEGMGVSSLFTTSANTVQGVASLGLNLSVVREVSAGKDNPERIAGILAAVKRLLLLTSLFGALICFALAPLLSQWTFGSSDYTYAFMALSLFVALTTASNGFLSLLQGLGEVKRLSKASLVGGLAGLFCGVPLYWFFGTHGIVPAMIVGALSMFLFYFISYRKSVNEGNGLHFKWNEHKPIVKRLISLGLVLMLCQIVGYFTNYLINLFVRIFGSVDNVGLFQAANSITNQYVGVVFSALALDYFPRLSASGEDTGKMRGIVNRQAEIVSLVLTPLVLLLILTAPLIIRLLLTKEFLSVTPLMRWMGLGVLLQGVSFPLNYIYLARGNQKIYIWLEVVISHVVWIACSMAFYYWFGLIGLGVSLVVRTAIDIVICYCVNRHFYGFRYSGEALRTIVISTLLGALAFAASCLPGATGYAVMSLLAVISIVWAFSGLRKRLRSDSPGDDMDSTD